LGLATPFSTILVALQRYLKPPFRVDAKFSHGWVFVSLALNLQMPLERLNVSSHTVLKNPDDTNAGL